uniref:F-box domain-containing protein n=1 Tax=Tanacetum cinerariifolium TaxID=118510 RepID=A0A6L2JGF0_TANCI|nr:hypothetical protein [Tanacetum cinerariifolium]
MSSNFDDIQATCSDTCPPMLDRTDYDSWDTLGTTQEGGFLLGLERPHTYDDLNDNEKKRFDANVRATNIVLQGLPKDIYKLINHNIKAKAIWTMSKCFLLDLSSPKKTEHLNYTMADMNDPTNDAPTEQAPAIAQPTRMEDQIFLLSKWAPISKSNCVLDFWDTMCFDSFTGLYSCQLDEQWFNLHKDILRDALDITPTNDNNPFRDPPLSDTVIEYVNTLGYPCTFRNVSEMSVNALYQPWRAILSMINMCLTEFVQSMQTFLTDRNNLTMASHGKKKSSHPLIPSVRFTKLIIHHLKTKHNIHLRNGPPLHYSHEENVLNTFRFIRKNGREIFGIPILDALLTDATKRAPYYSDYLEHVIEYQRYLDEEHDKTEEEEEAITESPNATKVTKPKAAKQTKPSAPKAPKVTKPADDKTPKPTSSQPPKPTPTPTEPSKKDQGNKHKLVKEAFDTPSHSKQSKAGKVTKKCMPKSPLLLIDEFVDEGVTGKETAYDDKEANLQLTLELSLKEQEKQRPTRPMRRAPMPTEPSRHAESPSLDEEVPEINSGDQDEYQARPNPSEHDKGQAGSNPDDAAESQPQSSHVVHVGPNLKHMDLEATDASTQQNSKQIDEEFTTTSYPNVQENLKLPTKDQPQEEEPEKTNIKYEVQSMVTVPIHQNTSSIPPITTPVIDLAVSQPVSTTIQAPLPTSTTTGTIITTTTTLPPPPPHPQQSTTDSIVLQCIVDKIITDAVDWAMQARFSDLFAVDMKEILQQRMFDDKSYEAHEDYKNLFDALQKSLKCDYSNQLLSYLEVARQKKRKRRSAQQQGSKAPSSSKTMATTPQSMAWTTSDIRYESTVVFAGQESSPIDSIMNDDFIPDEQMEECHKMLADQIKWANLNFDQVRIDVSLPMLLDGPPGYVTIQIQFFNKDLEYLRYGNKGSMPALPISKMKAARYPILKFYIDRHDSPSRRKEVRTYMRILSVVSIKVYSRYGYDYLSKIVLQRADFQEHTIAEKDFKNLYPSMLSTAVKLWTQNLVTRQRVEDFQLVVFPVDNNERKIMRFNEMYKFSDGTLTYILEALDYRVKEFKVKRLNPCMNTRIWTQKDMIRSKEFIAAIESNNFDNNFKSDNISAMMSQTRSTRGQENFAQPYLVFTNEDLLTEILIRLPILRIHLFTTISKQWLQIFTSPYFTDRRRKIPILNPPAGIFANHLRSLFECDFMSLDPRLESRKLTIDNSFTLGFNEEAYHVNILQSCNGLLLCSGWGSPAFYYVYNPSTNLFKRISQPDNLHDVSILYATGVLRMTFDPTKSRDYKVAKLFACLHAELEIQLYSSKTGNWSLCRDRSCNGVLLCSGFAWPIFYYVNNPSINLFKRLPQPNYYLRDDSCFFSSGVFRLAFDPRKSSHYKAVQAGGEAELPHMLHLEWKFFESCGCLLLVCIDDIGSTEFTIYEMMKGSSVWPVRYLVNIVQLLNPLPEGWSIRTGVCSICLGEGEDDALW